jgi:hypothetical protein
MAARSLLDFRAQLTGSGARPNLFNVTMSFPALAKAGAANALFQFMTEATTLPADKLGEIEVPFMGRKTYYPGDREFDPWTITVYCDENFAVRDAFENWLSGLNSHEGNTRDPIAAVPSGYSADPTFYQLSKIDGPALKAYKMTGAFPTEVGAMEYDWGTMNTIGKFNVTLRYQWWTALGQTGPTTDGSIPGLEA